MNRGILIAGLLYAAMAWAGDADAIRIDNEQWRDEPARHLLVHGVLNGGTRFTVMLPEKDAWRGRLMHFLGGGMGGVEDGGIRSGFPAFALANGAIYVESSQGYIGPSYVGDFTPADIAYKASHQVVLYARARSLQLYGREPAHSYVFGGSGGGFRSSGMLERFPKLYDGAVPTMGAGAIEFGYQVHSLRDDNSPIIASKLAALDDVFRTGGSGRVADAVDRPEQIAAVNALIEGGFPRSGWLFIRPNNGGFSLREYLRYQADPGYFEQFRRECGHCAGLVEGITGTVKKRESPGRQLAVELNRADGDLAGFTLIFTSGALKGQAYSVSAGSGQGLALSQFGPSMEGVQPGDGFTLDNRDLLAWHAYHERAPRMKVNPAAEPDRPVGRIQGKLIAIFGADDFNVWPVIGIRYNQAVERALGAATADHFRIHFIEHGQHSVIAPNSLDRQVADGHIVYKALTDVMAWVEQGVPAPAGTAYSVAGNQIVLPKSARARGGYQPVVELRAEGKLDRLQIDPGAEVRFHVEAEDPDNEVIQADMDFEGDNRFDETKAVRGRKVTAEFSHRYDQPGVYFATARVTDSTAIHGARTSAIQNLATVRVIVGKGK